MADRLRDADWIRTTLKALAAEIEGIHPAGETLALVGIRTRGSVVADRLAAILRETGRTVEVGHLDVTLYRDDLQGGGGRKAVGASDLAFDPNERAVFLVDDVLGTGRTVRAAMTEIMDFGRPSRIRLAVLIDRDGRELPICPDVLGERIEVDTARRLCVRFEEVDGEDAVLVE